MRKNINTNKFAEILLDTIVAEPYFSKAVLLPKIITLIKAFRLSLSASNYNKIVEPSETANLIRSSDIMNLEKHFWKHELKNIVGEDSMKQYYNKLDEQRQIWNTEEHCT